MTLIERFKEQFGDEYYCPKLLNFITDVVPQHNLDTISTLKALDATFITLQSNRSSLDSWDEGETTYMTYVFEDNQTGDLMGVMTYSFSWSDGIKLVNGERRYVDLQKVLKVEYELKRD